MKITLESTSEIVTVPVQDARVWTGTTEAGTQIHAYITRIEAEKGADPAELLRDLESAPPIERKQIQGRANFLKEIALHEIAQLAEAPNVTIEIPAFMLFLLVGQLQLAARHPTNTGPSADIGRQFIKDAQRALCQPGSPIDTIIKMGDDPRFDVDR